MPESDTGWERRFEDRRSGEDRRKEDRGIRSAYLFALFLDRRSGKDRRIGPTRKQRAPIERG